jgi:hypothetical protein
VGNDILYGFSAARTLGWVDEALERLGRLTQDIVLTDLPVASIRRLSVPKFVAFRSILVPSCRLSRGQVLDAVERVNEGLARLAATRGVRLLRLDPMWYGFDPIHVRPSQWRRAWQEILGIQMPAAADRRSRLEGLRLYLMRPERWWLFGVQRFQAQPGAALPGGGRVWLY